MPDVATRCDPGWQLSKPAKLVAEPNVSYYYTCDVISQGVHSIARDVNQATGSWGIAIIVPDACIRSHLCSHPNHREKPQVLVIGCSSLIGTPLVRTSCSNTDSALGMSPCHLPVAPLTIQSSQSVSAHNARASSLRGHLLRDAWAEWAGLRSGNIQARQAMMQPFTSRCASHAAYANSPKVLSSPGLSTLDYRVLHSLGALFSAETRHFVGLLSRVPSCEGTHDGCTRSSP